MKSAKLILIVLAGAFLFAFGLSFRSCGKKLDPPAPTITTTTRYETLPAPKAIHDTFTRKEVKWFHDTALMPVKNGPAVAQVMACDSIDTTTPSGTHCSFRQCFLLPDSVINRAAQRPVFSIQEPAPKEKIITNTVIETKYKKPPIDWKFELLKDGIICAGGILLGSKL